MPEPISPWNDSADCTSPDGRFRAIIVNACEVGMGAPTSGMLSIIEIADNGRVIARFESCSPSLVWSSDSAALAVPRWTRERRQRLSVIAVPSGNIIAEAEEFRVLELHEFDRGVVKGVDSPAYMPRAFEFVLDGSGEGDIAPA
jgi:hypothetical protein